MANTLGTVRLRNKETNDIILVPTPSRDPNDPLNWSPSRKYFIFSLTCFGIFFAHATVVGPSVALELITVEFFGDGPDAISSNISKTAYLQTGPSLIIGLGNLIWVPLAIKYGRRPVYIASYLLLTTCCVWSAMATTFPSALAARLLLGFACAAAEIVAPLTITDLFFLHQRGRVMVIYVCALSSGISVGVVFAGLITRNYSWRMIFWIFGAFVAACTLLVIFAFPETHYQRQSVAVDSEPALEVRDSDKKPAAQCLEHVQSTNSESRPPVPSGNTLRSLRVFTGTYTREPLTSLMLRPLAAIFLPGVLWATLVNSITIGMLVVISANFANAFSTTYGFETWQSGLTYISSIIGSIAAIFCGGHLSDWVADKLTTRNGGVRSPEMRLPSLVVSLITGPLACILYGVAIEKRLHWICASVGIGLVNFTTVQSNNVALVYILDSYRPIAGEVVVTQSVFKGFYALPAFFHDQLQVKTQIMLTAPAIFGFLISFSVNSWVQEFGYLVVFSIFAGVSAAVFLSTIPFYFYGDYLRQATWKWGFAKRFLHWHPDREVGE